ncbi:MAG: cation:proton antiporter, partial [Halapricum sp.]
WETGAFIVNTFIFLMIGVKTPLPDLLDNWELIAVAIPLTLLARAVTVYPLATLSNRLTKPKIPLDYQHVMIWGGLHGSIPIALVLGLPTEGLIDPAIQTKLRALVFGVAAFSLVVQGLTMGTVIDRLNIVTRSEAEELFELLIGRARAVDAALDAARDLHDDGNIPTEVYKDFTAEYEQEKDALNDSISELLSSNPELRREQLLTGERRILQQEKSAIMDSIRTGVVNDDTGRRLLQEVNLKLDRVRDGESTVERRAEGFEEFWRSQAREFGLEAVAEESSEEVGESDDEAAGG